MLYSLNGFWKKSYRCWVDDTVCWFLFSILLVLLQSLCVSFGFIGVALHCFLFSCVTLLLLLFGHLLSTILMLSYVWVQSLLFCIFP